MSDAKMPYPSEMVLIERQELWRLIGSEEELQDLKSRLKTFCVSTDVNNDAIHFIGYDKAVDIARKGSAEEFAHELMKQGVMKTSVVDEAKTDSKTFHCMLTVLLDGGD